MSKHRTVRYRGNDIDAGVLPLVKRLEAFRGVETRFSCQGSWQELNRARLTWEEDPPYVCLVCDDISAAGAVCHWVNRLAREELPPVMVDMNVEPGIHAPIFRILFANPANLREFVRRLKREKP